MTENKNKKQAPATTAGVVDSERFSRVLKDPRFRRPARKDSKIKVDDRFKGIFSDPKFTRPYKVDKYGRKLETKGAAKKEMEKFYRLEDEEENEILHVDSEGIETDASIEDDFSEDSDSSDDSSSDSSNDSSNDDYNNSVIEAFDQHPLVNSNIQIGDATCRLAIVNVDWDQLKAIDLFVLVNAFKPPMGLVKSVKIYPSEFGKERIAKEAIEGPPKEIFATENTRNEIFSENSNSEDSDLDDPLKDLKKAKTLVEESGNFDQNALRRYQLERLRYYYAVVECDSIETASAIYHHCDGREFETSTNTLDLRYIPDDVKFLEDEVTDISTSIPKKYTAKPAMVTDALQRSNVKLTWDQDDPDRRRLTRVSNHGKVDYEEADLRAYLASDSEEEIEEETQFKGMNSKEEKIARYRSLLLSNEGVDDVFGRKSHEDNDHLDITFTSALAGEDKDSDEENSDKDIDEEIERVAVFDEEGNLVANVEETSGNTQDSDDKKKKKNFFAKKEEKNEKFVLQKEWAKKGKGSGSKDKETGTSVSKTKKMHKKQSDLLDPSTTDSTFQVDLHDDRFKAVYNSPAYAIDPTAPMFKKTKGMEAIIGERQKRNRDGDVEMDESRKGKDKLKLKLMK